MQVILTRLLTLIALVLMPIGMAAAPAAAQPAEHHSAAAAGHCDPASDQGATDQTADCAMTCAAVVAPEPTAAPPPVAATPPPGRPIAQRGSGLHPEAATPPPKRA